VADLQAHFGVEQSVAEKLRDSVATFNDSNLRIGDPAEVKFKGYSPRGIVVARLGPVGWDSVEEVQGLVQDLDKKSKAGRFIATPAGVLTTEIQAYLNAPTGTAELSGTYGIVNYITVGEHPHKDGSGSFLKAHQGVIVTLDWGEEALQTLKKIRLQLSKVKSNALAIMRKRLKHPFSGGLGGL
jgi:hypothetical protein